MPGPNRNCARLFTAALLAAVACGCGGTEGGGGGFGGAAPAAPPASGDTVYVTRVIGHALGVGVVAESEGESLAAFGEVGPTGQLTRIAGAVVRAPDGRELTVWIGTDGLPVAFEAGGWVSTITKYVGNTIDVLVTSPSGQTSLAEGLPLPAGALQELRDLGAAGQAGSFKVGVPGAVSYFELTWPNALRVAGAIVSSIGCAVGVATITTGVSAFLAGVACGGALASWASLLTGNEAAGGVGTAVSVVTCVGAGDPYGCGSAAVDVIALAIEDAEDAQNWHTRELVFEGTITSAGRGDTFTFQAQAGTTVHILLNRRANLPDGSGTLDPYLCLYGPTGSLVTCKDDNGSDSPPGPYANSEIVYTTGGGPHTIYATGYQGLGDETGPYTLIVFASSGAIADVRRAGTNVTGP